jgi:hypothetical protein
MYYIFFRARERAMSLRPREGLSQHEKYLGFQQAFRTIKAYRSSESWLSAYVVAFSVFEDRLTAARLLCADLNREGRPRGHPRLYSQVEYLKKAGRIGEVEAREWKAAGDRRNSLLHAAMWNVEAVQEWDVVAVIKLARAADSLAAKLKRALKPEGT